MSSNAHALLSASGADRWMSCTPSARLESTLPEQKRKANSFDYSAEGTLAHEIAEIKLKKHYDQIDATEFELRYNVAKQSKYYNEEMENYVDSYCVYVRSQIGEGDRPLFEQKVDFSEWIPQGFGTADVVIISKNTIHIMDLKYGAGIPVSAIDNAQLRLYGAGTYSKFKEEISEIKTVKFTIIQPRLDNISSDQTTLEKLLDWMKYVVAPRAKKAWVGSGEFMPGDHCKWCRAKATCRARSDFNSEIAKLEFKDPPLLDSDEVSLVLSRAQDLRTWANDVEEYALTQAVDANIIPPGYKLSTTSTHRKINDQEMAAIVLVDKGISEAQIWEPRKLKSISALEKINKQVAAYLGDLVIRPEGQPKLVKDKAKDDYE
jgi:hypothetical protein